MGKTLTWIATAVAALAFAAVAAAAPLQQSVRPPDASYKVADNWNDRVCCKKGWQDWWTTRGACNRAGGYQTRNKDCREDWNDKWDLRWWGWNGGDWTRRVCCKRGNADWWTTARECRNQFGYEANSYECRNDANNGGGGDWNDRVCCKRGWQDWWSTRGACNRAGGVQVRNRECRDGNDWNDRWDQRWWGWNGGDWNTRVCCKQGRRDWWTTARECREQFGYQADRSECRNDDNNNGPGSWPGNNGGPGSWPGNNGNPNDNWQDPEGNPERRVCCKWQNGRDDWRSARECHYQGGWQVMNKECRDD